jgi:hypothetical protein
MAGATKLSKCPFKLCKAFPWVNPIDPTFSNASRRLIQRHDFVNPDFDLPRFSCPASLMYHPLDRASAERLVQEMFRIMRAQAAAQQAKPNAGLPANYASTGDGIKCLQCGGDHYPGQPHQPAKSGPQGARTSRLVIGAGDDAWQLGGREDEEIIPDSSVPVEGIVERIPLVVSGVLNGGTGMDKGASIAGVQAAVVKGQEAQAVVGSEGFGLEAHVQGVRAQVEGLLDDAITMLKGVIGQGESEKLSTAIAELSNARDNFNTMAHHVSLACGDVRRSIRAAEEAEQEFIRVVSSI